MTTIERSSDADLAIGGRSLIFSVDDHALEHSEVWTSRMSAKTWGDRIPQLHRDRSTGNDYWVIDGRRLPLREVAAVGALTGDRASGPERWADVDPAASDPRARLVAMDVDGVSDSVLYPLVAGLAGQRFGSSPDVAFELACAAAYNDYLIDEWVAHSPRFIGQAIVPVGDVDLAVAEIVRSVERGHRGVILPGNPKLLRSNLPHLNEPHWDPIWRICAEVGVPVAFHSGSSPQIQFPAYADLTDGQAAALDAITRPVSSSGLLTNLLFSGILIRFPALKVVFSETTLSWAAFVLESAEHSYRLDGKDRYGIEVSPTEQFRRQVYVTGWYDTVGFATRYHVGVDNLLWSTNFPQATSCWPDSRATFAAAAVGVPGDERADILHNNARRLYSR